MSRSHIPESIRERVREAARFQCGYCQTQEIVVSYPLHIEHLLPEAKGGTSDEENLWLTCSVCNNYEGHKRTQKTPRRVKLCLYSTLAHKTGRNISPGVKAAHT